MLSPRFNYLTLYDEGRVFLFLGRLNSYTSKKFEQNIDILDLATNQWTRLQERIKLSFKEGMAAFKYGQAFHFNLANNCFYILFLGGWR